MMFELTALVIAVLAALVLGVLGFFRTLGQGPRNERLTARLKELEIQVQLLRGEVSVLRRDQASSEFSAPTPTEAPTVVPVAAPVHPEPVRRTTAVPLAPRPVPAAPATPTAPGRGWEELLGTQWTVWVGGLALALGGLFLVRYSIEAGLLGPAMRTVLATLLAATLLGLGEWTRRNPVQGFSAAPGNTPTQGASGPAPERKQQGIQALTPTLAKADIPSILTAAGTVVAFGTAYGAHALYGFVGPAAAFVLLAAIGMGTLLASLRHGPWIAALGLAGTYVAPLLVSSPTPNPWPVVILLAVVASAAGLLAAVRNWGWLALVAVAGAAVWGVLMLLHPTGGDAEWVRAAMVHIVLQMAIAGAVLALVVHAAAPDETAVPDWISTAALALLTCVAIAALSTTVYVWRPDAAGPPTALPRLPERLIFTCLAAGLLATIAWLVPAVSAALGLAGAIVVAELFMWAGSAAFAPRSTITWEYATLLPVPAHVEGYAVFAIATALAILMAGFLRVRSAPALGTSVAAPYLAAAAVTPLLALIVAYLRITQLDQSISFAFFAAVLALILVTLCARFRDLTRMVPAEAYHLATGVAAASACAAIALALTMLLTRGYLTVALALAALGTAYVAVRLQLPVLRAAVGALGVIVMLRLAWDPRIMGADVGRTPILNWLLLGYGVPALSFAAASWLMRRDGEDRATAISDALATLLTALLVFFQIRHMLTGGDVLTSATSMVEQGLLFIMAVGFSYGLHRLDVTGRNPVFQIGSLIAGGASIAIAALGLGIIHNPWWSGERIVGPVGFSTLLLGYGLPALAAAVVTRRSLGGRPHWYTLAGSILALLLLFAFVSLEVRHLFQGPIISSLRRTGQTEFWTYSVAWLGLGILLLAYGLVLGSQVARLASAGFILLTVAKVFLFDLSGLTGILRALSLLALGAVLIAIGVAYQRWVFRRPGASATPDPRGIAYDLR